jgi:hypothetical protein
MSLAAKPGHVKNIGSAGSTYAFYMFGCNGTCSPPVGREYSSRVVTIK